MPLTPEQLQELQELEELEQLEQKFGGNQLPEPSFVEQGIDMIPGMKQRREGIAQYRSTPEYKASHPQAVTGMEDPALQYGLGMAGPESAASMIKGLANFLKPAAKRAEVSQKVKNVGELEPYVQGKINEASEMFNKKQIGPRMLEQESRMAGKTVKVDPKSMQGLDPDIDSVINSYPIGVDGLAEIPAQEALKLRAQINKVAGWKSSPGDPMKARALDEQAAMAHKNLAEQFSSADPAMEALSKELQQAYNIQKQAVGSAGRNPINSVVANDGVSGLAKKGRLANFDEQAGSELAELGQNIKTANDRSRPMGMSDIFSIHGPKAVANKLSAPALNAYDDFALRQLLVPQVTGASKARAIGQKVPVFKKDER